MLAGVEVDDSPDQFVPIFAVLVAQMFRQLHYVVIDDFDAPVDVRLLWISDASEPVALLDDLGEVP